MKKRVLSLILSLTMAGALLAGCGSAASSAASTAESKEESAAPSEAAPAEESKEEAAPASSEAPAEEPAADNSPKNIAYLNPSTTIPFWNWIQHGIEAEAEKYGYTVTTYDSNNDAATQLKNAQNVITQGVDAIIISPTDSASCPAVLQEAEDAGVPVVIVDIGTDSGNYLATVSTPNYEGSYAVGEFLVNYLEENNLSGSIGELTISLARINGQRRVAGFADAIAKAGLEVSTMLEAVDYTVEEADSQTRNIVTANPDLICVYANNSEGSIGAVSALEDLGLIDKVVVVAFDGNPEIVDSLREGKIKVCSAQQAKKMGKEGLAALARHFAGEEVEKEIFVDTILLTADNVDDMIDVIGEDVCDLYE